MFFLDQKLKKMINCEHGVVKHVVSLFFQLNVNKLNPISVTKIEEIIYATNQGYHIF